MGGEWLIECYNEYPKETSTRYSDLRQDLDQVERDVQERRSKRGSPAYITQKDLKHVENHPRLGYDRWWNKLSAKMGTGRVPFKPEDLLNDQDNDQDNGAIEDLARALWNKLKDIKVVSVHVRFLMPEVFAIFSDPVIALLNLAPPRRRGDGKAKNRVNYYLSYLRNLRDIRKHYWPNCSHGLPTSGNELRRIADIERALWCAAHLSEDHALVKEMNRDEFFQEMRLSNLVRNLGDHWNGSPEQQLILARALLKHDHTTAALVASMPFEKYLVQFALNEGIKRWTTCSRTPDDKPAGSRRLMYYAKWLEYKDGWNRGGRFLADELTNSDTGLISMRNRAVHPGELIEAERVGAQLTREEAEDFVMNVITRIKNWRDSSLSAKERAAPRMPASRARG